MKLLITGVNGFVAQHFLSFLSGQDRGFKVLGLGRSHASFNNRQFPGLDFEYASVDLSHKQEVGEIIKRFKPEFLLHLASISSVSHSWKHPQESFVNNTNIFLNLVDQIRLQKINCRILSIGSSDEYGNVKNCDVFPLTEESPLNPISPYAVARVSQEMISKIYEEGYGMDIIMTRSFNHIGPGQKDTFVVSSFAKQLVKVSTDKSNETVATGNLNIIRDFVDVRDVVKAYYLLLTEGVKGQVYNICSGEGISLHDILNKMCAILKLEIKLHKDPELIRPNDNKIVVGSSAKIRALTGWTPSITIDQSLADIISWWKLQAVVAQ